MMSSSRWGGEIAVENAAKIFLCGAWRRAVVVGEVEVGDAEVESPAQHRLSILEGVDAAEIVPEAERNGGEKQSAAATAAVLHGVVT